MTRIYRFISTLQDELRKLNQRYVLYLNTPCGTFRLNDPHIKDVMKAMSRHHMDYVSLTIERYSREYHDTMSLQKCIPIIEIQAITTSSMQEHIKTLAQYIDAEFCDFEKQQLTSIPKEN